METGLTCATAPPAHRNGWAAWRSYVKLVRFHYHISFVIVLLGVLTVTRTITVGLMASLAGLYVSFNILLYGAIYAINAIADVESDREHPLKSRRPLAGGEIAVNSALRFAGVLLGCGLLSGGVFFGAGMLAVYAGFVATNLFYTFIAKRIAYLEIVFNGLTYPLRYFMGAHLAGGRVSVYLLSLVFLVAVGACALRRRVEGTDRYSHGALLWLEALPLAAMGLLRLIDRGSHNVFYICAGGTHLALVFGPKVFPPMRRGLLQVWTK